MKINKIVIVGGGSSGWISASFLKKSFPDKEIVVIESKNISTVGVGESTLADITNYRDYLGIKEKDFIKSTDASYKMSIKFTDFYKKDSGGFHYPFRTPYLKDTKNGLIDWLEIKASYPELPVTDFVDCYFPQAQLFNKNKFNDNINGEFENWNPKTDVAYHFDATKFGIFLKNNHCIPNGVKIIYEDVFDVKLNEDGIEYLILKNKEKIFADLFIDCTGFKSLLLGEYLKEPFESYQNILPNNRAWATQIPYIDKELELEPFTNCTAIENGWCWNIPLWSRLGSGYVYSDKYTSPENALIEFKNYLKSKKMVIPRNDSQISKLSFKDIEMKIGIRKRLWVKNVVAIGLSAGFIEPLESNGLFSVFWYINHLSKSLLRDEVSELDKDIFNYSTKTIFNNLAEFISMHYSLSIRRDTEYWKDISKINFSKDFMHNFSTSTIGYKDFATRKMFIPKIDETAGITYISVGMNYFIFDRIDQKMNIFDYNIYEYLEENINIFNYKKEKWKIAAEKSPSLYKYLRNKYYE